MPALRPVALFCLLVLAVAPARAQSGGPEPDVLKAGVMQLLSLATFGLISVQDQQVTVAQDGPDYRMRLKLSGFSAPPDAAITAVVRPLDRGRVDIESMAFPSSGTIETTLANGLTTRTSFAIGKQAISGKVDPALATESSYAADFSDVRLWTGQGDQHSEQTIDHIATDGTFSAGADGRLNLVTQSRGIGWHMIGRSPKGFQADVSARAIAAHCSIEGLDRAQGDRLAAAFRGLVAADAQARSRQDAARPDGARPDGAPPVQLPAARPSPEQRRELGAAVEAMSGLLNRVEIDETMEGVRFSLGTPGGGAGTIGSLRLTIAGDATQARLNTRLGLVMEQIAVPSMAAETSQLIPHHVDMKTVMAGVQVTRLIAFLRAATQEGADPALLQAQAQALLDDSNAKVAVESLSFDSGPLSVSASAKLSPYPNGQLGGAVHIAARGVDALLAQVQSQPKLQQAVPLIFLAKGMGRQQGDSLVWDIALGDGPLTINGVPFGQPAGNTR